MKKGWFIVVVALWVNSAFSQNSLDNQRFIEVVGVAEQWLTPSEYHYEISIDQTMFTTDDDVTDVSNSTLKFKRAQEEALKKLVDLVYKEGFTEKDFVKDKYAVGGDTYAVAKLTLRVKDLKKIETLVQRLRDSKAYSGAITYMGLEKEADARESLQLEAVKNAKTKAAKLLSVTNNKVGNVLQITERQDYDAELMNSVNMVTLQRFYTNAAPNATPRDNNAEKVRIQESVTVRFAILD